MENHLDILFEDNHLIIINKASGSLVQADVTGDLDLTQQVKLYIKEKYNKPGDVYLGTLHRLDRPVSGVLVFARTSKAAERISKQFQKRLIKKSYLAVLEGSLEQEKHVISFLKKDQKNNKVSSFDHEVPGSQKAETIISPIANFKNQTLVKVSPITGRSHQIRVHCALIGYPIICDTKYGSQYKSHNRSLCLHAHSISFEHPTTKIAMNITAPAPQVRWWNSFKDVILD